MICSAQDDKWADPRGEFLRGQGADGVYRLLGTDGLAVRDMPGVNVLVRSAIGYHLRPGPHDVTDADWDAYARLRRPARGGPPLRLARRVGTADLQGPEPDLR